MDKTMIEVTKETRARLKLLKIVNKESYNEIIIRLIKKEETENGTGTRA